MRIEEAYPLIAQARARLQTEHAPDKALLPVEPTERYPVPALKQSSIAGRIHLLSEGTGVMDVVTAGKMEILA